MDTELTFCSTPEEANRWADEWSFPLDGLTGEVQVSVANRVLRSLRRDFERLLSHMDFASEVFEVNKRERQRGLPIAENLATLFQSNPALGIVDKILDFPDEKVLRTALGIFQFEDAKVESLTTFYHKFGPIRSSVSYAKFIDVFGDHPLVDGFDTDVNVSFQALTGRIRLFDPEGTLLLQYFSTIPSLLEMYGEMIRSVLQDVDRLVRTGRLQADGALVAQVSAARDYAQRAVSRRWTWQPKDAEPAQGAGDADEDE